MFDPLSNVGSWALRKILVYQGLRTWGCSGCICTNRFGGKFILHPLNLKKSDFVPLNSVQKNAFYIQFYGQIPKSVHTVLKNPNKDPEI